MNIDEAKAVLFSNESNWRQKCEAAGVITTSNDATIRDLVDCLRIGGSPAEWAAIKLHRITGRERPKEFPNFYMKPEDWEEYINKNDDK